MKRIAVLLVSCLLGACSGAQEEAPFVVSSSPELEATGVYPAPVWSGLGEEVTLGLTFSEPMQLDGELLLEASDHERPPDELTWSDDQTELTLVFRASFEWAHPLADDTEYSLDLSSLASETGQKLEPDVHLRDRRLVFSTGRFDPLLNHSCGHTFFGPYGSVAAVDEPRASAPDISTTHTQYTVTLPEDDGAHSGWLRARFPTKGPYRLYFDADTRLALARAADEDAEEVELERTPAACAGIVYEVTVYPTAGEDLFLRLGPEDEAARRIIVELIPPGLLPDE